MKRSKYLRSAIILTIGIAGFIISYLFFFRPVNPLGNKVFIFEECLAQEGCGILNLRLSESLKPFKIGQREIQALKEAYSDKIKKVRIRDGEWALYMDGIWFYWLGGRLLPETLIQDKKDYSPYKFYRYTLKLPQVPLVSDEQIMKIRKKQLKKPVNTAFFDVLYTGFSYREIRRSIKTISFMGYRIDAHKKIVPILKDIEKAIREVQKKDDYITGFLRSLRSIDCFSWRGVESSMTRSFHSYGIAVDFIPPLYVGKEVYWAWTRYHNSSWYDVPYEERWMIPGKIVDIFEKYGFVWGGKWLFYDNMHFEYRPELLILAGQDIKSHNEITVKAEND